MGGVHYNAAKFREVSRTLPKKRTSIPGKKGRSTRPVRRHCFKTSPRAPRGGHLPYGTHTRSASCLKASPGQRRLGPWHSARPTTPPPSFLLLRGRRQGPYRLDAQPGRGPGSVSGTSSSGNASAGSSSSRKTRGDGNGPPFQAPGSSSVLDTTCRCSRTPYCGSPLQ